MVETAIAKLREQQAKVAAHSAPWMVAQQLMDICRNEPACAELIAQNLDNEKMSIVEAEKKIKALADAHHKKSGGNSAAVSPMEAEKALRKFYGLPKQGEAAPAGGITTDYRDLLR